MDGPSAGRFVGPIGVRLTGCFSDNSVYWLDLRQPNGVRYVPNEAAKEPGASHVHGANPLHPPERRGTLTAWLHVANGCNLSCDYCYIPHLRKALPPSAAASYLMSAETIESTISGLLRICATEGFDVLNLKFAGGEPTLNLETIRRACSFALEQGDRQGIRIGFRILTNGVFEPSVVVPLLREYLFGVSISVDGDPAAHDKVRFTLDRSGDPIDALTTGRPQRRGTWDRVVESIKELRQSGLKPYLLCTVDERNYRSLMPLVEYCCEGEMGFRLSPVRDKKTYAIPGLQAEMLSELGRVYGWIGDNYPVGMPIERFARFAEWNLRKRKDIACGSCRSMLAIGQHGEISSCQMRMNVGLGKITEPDAAKVFDVIRGRDDYAHMVRPDTKTGSCADCRFRYTCAGGCPEHSRQVFGTTNTPSPWCELYTGMMPIFVRAIATQIKRGVDQHLGVLRNATA